MNKTKEWVIVCYGLTIFFTVVGVIGGFWGGDHLAERVALVVVAGVAWYAVNRGRKAGI